MLIAAAARPPPAAAKIGFVPLNCFLDASPEPGDLIGDPLSPFQLVREPRDLDAGGLLELGGADPDTAAWVSS